VCRHETVPRRYSGFVIEECPSCGAGFLDEGDERDDYWTGGHGNEEWWLDAKRRYFERALQTIGARAPGRRLLDIGGGMGAFAQVANSLGWDAYSLDVSQIAYERASKRLGAGRALRSLPESEHHGFDAATMWCVVAHTRNPTPVLDLARSALRPGGTLWLTTPNFALQKRSAAIRSSVGRGNFASDDHHLQFTARSLELLLEAHGFEDVAFRYAGVTETCFSVGSSGGTAVLAKRAWNRTAHTLARVGVPNLMSELQVTARLGPRAPD
jgi:SAM-dependent methyltransferase